ncbi:MAG: carbohydrate ABC transporter permease [Provencibacterium sp.]|jgi:putative aldouronate transport system permease protein|nr:carbohydrate ABC transporter permease [Provencibacterium sp.]
MAKPSKSHISLSRGDQIFTVVNYTVLGLLMLVVAYPLVFVLSASFSSANAVTSGRVWLLPVEPTLLGYQTVFKNPDIVRSFFNSIQVMVVGTFINVILTVMAAYPLARKDFYGRGFFTALLSFTMLFNGGLIPTFLLVRNLGLYNTYWAIILPGAVSVYNVVVARTYFQTNIPDELYEAADLDGCGDIGFIVRIVLPLSAPILAVLTMFYAVGHWNSYFSPMIYLTDKKLFTLQLVLRNILIANQTDSEMMKDVEAMARQEGLAELLKYALIVVASVPMLIIYPFIQKHFVKGVMIGALKG